MGAGVGGRQARGARQAGSAVQARAEHAGYEQPGRWARGLATGCALTLFSIRIDSVLFLSRFLDIVLKPGS